LDLPYHYLIDDGQKSGHCSSLPPASPALVLASKIPGGPAGAERQGE